MQKPTLEPPVADLAPADPVLTGYDEQHLVTYMRFLDAENDVDPRAWLADVLARIAGHPANRLDELLPGNWAARRDTARAA